MNIKEAKEQISNAMTSYFTKNQFGKYMIPIEKQRPIFLMGPPGIGKTAIMEQIAQELNVGIVSYSMTHHTRQSALGLPFIVKREYDGKEYDISEYTMSEIITSVYDLIENTGKREGILFLDEINCVSETLAPSMLQFLQYKIFGKHRVPEGWIVVTAGNPPEYNNSVREFDIVTWDRLKRIDVEPDYDVWKEYAYKSGVHASIVTYLDIKKSNFYKIETTVDGKCFVTARGWSDLSDMIKLYELQGIIVDEKLVKQYLQNPKIAKDFAVYYDLYNKYKSDYQIDSILEGHVSEDIKDRAKEAKFDEKLTLLGLLIEGITCKLKDVIFYENALVSLQEGLKNVGMQTSSKDLDISAAMDRQIEQKEKYLVIAEQAGNLSEDSEYAERRAIQLLEEEQVFLREKGISDMTEGFKVLKKDFDKKVKDLEKTAKQNGEKLSNVFKFCEEVFVDGQELLILVTELTVNYYGALFIGKYGCQEYFNHNKELLFYERQKEIIAEIHDLRL